MKTYGTLTYDADKKQWEVSAEPHVILRLKRVFGSLSKTYSDSMIISATPDNSRDLEWFIERYPLKVTEPEKLVELSKKHKDTEAQLYDLLTGAIKPAYTGGMKIPPYDYQMTAAQVWHTTQGYLLADEVGLGKTISFITGIVEPNMLPALVVTLSHLGIQAQEEIHRFTDLTTHIIKGGPIYNLAEKKKRGKSETIPFPDVVIINYHKLAKWSHVLSGLFKSIIFDEVHELRHTDSQKYQAAQLVSSHTPYRIGLSATPIFGYGGEIYNVLNILRPGALGTFEEFTTEWCLYLQNGKWKIKDPKAFGGYIRDNGLMLRRTRKMVGRELPRVQIIPHAIESDVHEITKVEDAAMALAQKLLMPGEEFRGQKMQTAAEFDLKLREATGVSKAPYVAEFVKMLHETTGEKIVVFAWHRKVYDILMIKLHALNPRMYTGSESPEQKNKNKLAFTEGDCNVLLISNRAGAGLDGLQNVCHIGVVAELDYSPSVHIQNIGRIDRDGQQTGVLAYFMIGEYGSDPVISDILGLKRQQLEGINNPNTEEEFLEDIAIDEPYIKRLATEYIIKHGGTLPEGYAPSVPSENSEVV